MATQRCGRCKETKDENEFSPSYRGRDGTWCRSCFAAHARGESAPRVVHPARPCVQCGKMFSPKALKKNGRDLCSRACKEADAVASGRVRDSHLRRKYGITASDYDAMLVAQGGRCALCDATPETQRAKYTTYFHVDHCHDTGRVRGLLCGEHNLLLGRFNDDPSLLRRAADYIEGRMTP